MTKRAAFLLMIIVPLLLFTGCWSRREVNELAIVMGVGVDRTPDNRVRLTVQIARPSAYGGGAESVAGSAPKQNNFWVISETGRTIFDAERNLALKVSRQIYWGHVIILVYGEEMAKGGVRDVSNFFMRNPMTRETIWVMITKGEAKRLLESHSELEKSSAQSLANIARNKAGHSVILKDFQVALASKGTNPTAPRVELQKAGEPQGVGMEEKLQHEEAVITGTGIFKEEKLVGWLDNSETSGLSWLLGDVMDGAIIVPSPGQPDKQISLKIVGADTKVDPEYNGEIIRFNVKITLQMDLLEQQSTEELSTPEKIKAIESAAAGDIYNKCSAALKKSQGEYGTDVFYFGEAFHRKYKKDWKVIKNRWNDEFKNAEVNISVESHLRGAGMLRRRASTEK